MRRALFWSSGLLIAYTYVLFPLVVIARGLLLRRPVRSRAVEPTVSVLIAARNEAAALPAKLDSLMGLDYPSERLEVVIASDGSTDGTNAIVEGHAARAGVRVRLLPLPRTGKAAALNAAARVAAGEILVFSDANSMFRRDALRALVRPFADPEVGGVAGNQVYTADGKAGEVAGERGYWGFDTLLKEFESRAGSAIAGTGAIYAVRQGLFRPIPAGVNDDFYTSAGVIEQGHRLVFAADAVATEAPALDMDAEYARKVRVVSRAVRCVVAMRGLLSVRRHGFYAVQLLSHKVLRWIMAAPLLVLLVSSASLARVSTFHAGVLAIQAACYGLALAGGLRPRLRSRMGPLLAVPTYFVMVNLAATHAIWNVLTGRTFESWEPANRIVATASLERVARR